MANRSSSETKHGSYLHYFSSKNSTMAVSIMNKSDSIYTHLQKYLSKVPLSSNISAPINYFLTHFYLRLTGLIYCRLNNINSNAPLTDKVKNDIIHFMVDTYDNNSPAAIKEI